MGRLRMYGEDAGGHHHGHATTPMAVAHGAKLRFIYVNYLIWKKCSSPRSPKSFCNKIGQERT
jgi:hypothetical protein